MSQCHLACGRQKPVSCWRMPLPPQGSLKKPQNPSSLTDDVSCRGLWLDRLFPWTHSFQKYLLSMPICKGYLSQQGRQKAEASRQHQDEQGRADPRKGSSDWLSAWP